MSDPDRQWKTPTGPTKASKDPELDGGLWLFLIGFDVFATIVTFQLYGLVNSVLVALVVMTGIGCAGLWKMGRLSTGNVFAFGLHAFFVVQLGAILGTDHIGVKAGPFVLPFAWWVALAIATLTIHFRSYWFGTGTGTSFEWD
jgi:hypothetical protein